MLFHIGATAICPHGGQITVVSSNTRVLVSGMPVATIADTSLVAGCAFVLGTTPHPCVTVQWLTPATRVTVNGQPVLLQSSTGLCQSADQTPQGPPTIVSTQTRVGGI
jgi:uncharacterized Zn-binding protein involved in type VI secretion